MFKSAADVRIVVAPLAGVILTGLAVTQLTGCVVRVAAPPPPPPAAYVAPPPPPAAEPADEPAGDADVQASEPPPQLPEYTQPPCPVEGYIWTPGYWAFGVGGGYYWVPGTWVAPPRVGVLWTPPYWGFVRGVYVFHAGYWGPHIGFYGGVNYGFGYTGVGFAGGRWVGSSFAYNQSVTNVNVTVVHNTYNETVVNNVTVNRVSYNGGAGGTLARPTPQERLAAQDQHVAATPAQHAHMQQASGNPALLAKNNGGRPSIAATPRPSAFHAPEAVGTHGTAAPAPHPAAVAHVQPGNGTAPHANAAHPGAMQHNGAHPNTAQQNGRQQPKPNAAKQPKNPENGKHERETVQR